MISLSVWAASRLVSSVKECHCCEEVLRVVVVVVVVVVVAVLENVPED